MAGFWDFTSSNWFFFCFTFKLSLQLTLLIALQRNFFFFLFTSKQNGDKGEELIAYKKKNMAAQKGKKIIKPVNVADMNANKNPVIRQ